MKWEKNTRNQSSCLSDWKAWRARKGRQNPKRKRRVQCPTRLFNPQRICWMGKWSRSSSTVSAFAEWKKNGFHREILPKYDLKLESFCCCCWNYNIGSCIKCLTRCKIEAQYEDDPWRIQCRCSSMSTFYEPATGLFIKIKIRLKSMIYNICKHFCTVLFLTEGPKYFKIYLIDCQTYRNPSIFCKTSEKLKHMSRSSSYYYYFFKNYFHL